MGVLIDNPMISVQFQLRGGLKSLLVSTGIFSLLVFGATGLWVAFDPTHIRSFARGLTVVLMLMQVAITMLFAAVRVSNAVRQDNISGIMESHRLMPLTGLSACVGYVIGPALPMLAIGLVTFAAGILSCDLAGDNSYRWVVANAILLVFLLFLCAGSVFVGFYRRALFNFFIAFAVISFFSQGVLLFALPAMAVLASPLAGQTIFLPQASVGQFTAGVFWAFLGQGVLGAIFVTAGARKFREPERPAFSVLLAMTLLATWVGLNLLGMLRWEAFEPAFIRMNFGVGDQRTAVQFPASVLTAVLLSLLPISAAVRYHRQRGRPLVLIGTILLCAAVICLFLIVPLQHNRQPARPLVGWAALSIVSAVLGLGSACVAQRSTRRKTISLILLYLLVTWCIPLIADVIYHAVVVEDGYALHEPWRILACGPIGTMIAPWHPDMQTQSGLYCQLGTAIVMITIAFAAEQRRIRGQKG